MDYLLLLFYFFFFFIRPQDWWGPLLYVPVDYIVIISIIICIFPSFPKHRWILKLPQIKFLLLYLLAVVLSNLLNGDIDASLEFGMKYLKFTVIFFVIATTVDSYRKVKFTIIYIICLILFIAIQGIIQKETGINWAGQTLYWADRIRWVGNFDGANNLAMLFVSVIPFLIVFILGPWNYIYKLFAVISGVFIMNGLYLANSRGGYLSFLITIFFLVNLKLKSKISIVASVIVVIGLLAVGPSRMSTVDDPHKSSRARIESWTEALEMVKYDPVFGIGKGQFANYTKSYVAHNVFLQNLGEIGLVGTFFWLGWIYVSLLGLLQLKKNMEIKKDVHYSLLLGLILNFIGLLSAMIFITADHPLIYIWIALYVAVLNIEKVDIKISRNDYMYIGAFVLIGVAFAYIAVNAFKAIY